VGADQRASAEGRGPKGVGRRALAGEPKPLHLGVGRRELVRSARAGLRGPVFKPGGRASESAEMACGFAQQALVPRLRPSTLMTERWHRQPASSNRPYEINRLLGLTGSIVCINHLIIDHLFVSCWHGVGMPLGWDVRICESLEMEISQQRPWMVRRD
jgi:hypothetical protein